MAASFNALLEAHALTLLPIFHRHRVGNMVVRRAEGSRAQLAESALARTCSESVRIFKQQQMGAIRRPTRRSTGRGFDFASPPPVSFSLSGAPRRLTDGDDLARLHTMAALRAA